VLGSNSGRDIGYPECGLSWFSSDFQPKYEDNISIGHDVSLPHHFQFTRRRISCNTEKVVKPPFPQTECLLFSEYHGSSTDTCVCQPEPHGPAVAAADYTGHSTSCGSITTHSLCNRHCNILYENSITVDRSAERGKRHNVHGPSVHCHNTAQSYLHATLPPVALYEHTEAS
jgi:hypothetical protein